MCKKFFLLVIFTPVVFFSCPLPPIEEEDDPFITDVKWSADWKYVTIYLEGELVPDEPAAKIAYNPPDVLRAMTLDTVRVAFDYFEVVFYHDEFTARTSWEIGSRAILKDVYREGGVDYSRTSAASLPANAGAAILFAGRMTGRTLMALGKVISVDEIPGALVKEDSHFVTFELFAFTGKTSYNPSLSNFQMDNMMIKTANIGGRLFPLYVLPLGRAGINAYYRFDIKEIKNDGTEKTLTADERDAFLAGVIVAESGVSRKTGEAFVREARYPRGNGHYWYPNYAHDTTTVVTMTNNHNAGRPAQIPIAFEIDTTATYNPAYSENGLFILSFQVPVYAIEKAQDDEALEVWFIRAAYQSYNYNIDNGLDSTGGGVLMGAVDPQPGELDVGRVWW